MSKEIDLTKLSMEELWDMRNDSEHEKLFMKIEKETQRRAGVTRFLSKDGWDVTIDNEVLEKMSKEATRERVDDINECDTLASVEEYLEDNPFGEITIEDAMAINPHLRSYDVDSVLNHALHKPTNINFTQYQLKLQECQAESRAYSVLLRIMEIRFGLERIL